MSRPPAGAGATSWNGNTLPSWQGAWAIAFQAMRLDYHKLVRDGIPRIIEAGGGQPVTRALDTGRIPGGAGRTAAIVDLRQAQSV